MPSEMKCVVSELDKLRIAVIFDRTWELFYFALD